MAQTKCEHWTLLAIDAAGQDGLTPVQIQKALFLLSKRYRTSLPSDFYRFIAHNYGPFDSRIYVDAEALALNGLVERRTVEGQRWRGFAITPQGHARAEEVRKAAPSPVVEALSRLVTWARSLSFQQLVRAIYEHYPEYRANSVFQD